MVEYNWTTFQGKHVTLDTVDHQHLSNSYWYLKIIQKIPNDRMQNLIDKVSERFNGQILPYRPHVNFEYEINMLKESGMLDESDPLHIKINFQGKVIGEIIKF